MIRLSNVTVSYTGHIALGDISLNIEKGEHLAVIGPNGAGKTTLLTAVNGLGAISKGEVTVGGLALKGKNIREIQKITGYVPQHHNADSRFPACVYDIVMMGRTGRIGLLKRETERDREIVESSLKLCSITSLRNRPIGYLSGGEKQKVFIARAMAQEPEILLFDEPTASLDLKAQKEVIALIDKIYEEKRLTIVFVTHILGHIPQTCNKGCLIKDGRILFTGTIKDALETEKLEILYGCKIAKSETLTYVRDTSI